MNWLKFFPCGSAGKESTCNAGDLGLIPGLGRSAGEGKGYPLQYSGLENSMDYTVCGVTKSWTQLSHFHFTLLASICYLVMSNFLIYSLPGGIGVGAAWMCSGIFQCWRGTPPCIVVISSVQAKERWDSRKATTYKMWNLWSPFPLNHRFLICFMGIKIPPS